MRSNPPKQKSNAAETAPTGGRPTVSTAAGGTSEAPSIIDSSSFQTAESIQFSIQSFDRRMPRRHRADTPPEMAAPVQRPLQADPPSR